MWVVWDARDREAPLFAVAAVGAGQPSVRDLFGVVRAAQDVGLGGEDTDRWFAHMNASALDELFADHQRC